LNFLLRPTGNRVSSLVTVRKNVIFLSASDFGFALKWHMSNYILSIFFSICALRQYFPSQYILFSEFSTIFSPTSALYSRLAVSILGEQLPQEMSPDKTKHIFEFRTSRPFRWYANIYGIHRIIHVSMVPKVSMVPPYMYYLSQK
jgi:hypothetical protein